MELACQVLNYHFEPDHFTLDDEENCFLEKFGFNAVHVNTIAICLRDIHLLL